MNSDAPAVRQGTAKASLSMAGSACLRRCRSKMMPQYEKALAPVVVAADC